ncbi:MAG: hypothetical protein AAFW73_15950 [Bacteroidota bacterium]
MLFKILTIVLGGYLLYRWYDNSQALPEPPEEDSEGDYVDYEEVD